MEQNELTAALRKAIESGLDREETKRELISQGIGTSGFDEVYAAVLQELGKKEPVRKVPAHIEALRNDRGTMSHSNQSLENESLLTLFKQGIRLAVSHWRFSLLVSIVLLLPALVTLGLRSLALGVPLFELSVFILGIILSVLAWGSILYVGALGHEPIKQGYALQWALGNFIPLTWLTVTLALTIIGGLSLFVFPGLLIFTYSVFAYVILVQGNARGVHILMRSIDLVKGTLPQTSIRVALLTVCISLPVVFLFALSASFAHVWSSIPLAFITTFVSVTLALCGIGATARWYRQRRQERSLFDYSAYGGIKWLYRLFLLIGLAVVVIWLTTFNGFAVISDSSLAKQFTSVQMQLVPSGDDREKDAFQIADVLTKSKVEATAASVRLSGGRMGDYDGACEDVSVVHPVVCRSRGAQFVVFAPTVSGAVYCIDHSGFSGEVLRSEQYACELRYE